MKPITVVGIGSPFGADRIGWEVVEYLKNDHALQTLCENRVCLLACDRPGLLLLEYIKNTSLAILVDAIDGGEAGKINYLQQDQLLLSKQNLSSHSAGVADALKLGDKLNLLPDDVVLYGIEVGKNRGQFNISREKIEQIVQLIIDEIEDRINRDL